MTSARPATIRVYFDADGLGLAKLLCQVRADFTFPGDPGGRVKKLERPPCPITSPGARDPVWIRDVPARGWLIVTRDRAIQENRAEINAVREHGARMVNLASADADRTWTQLEVLMRRWREIEALIDEPGPFIYVASRTGRLRSVDLSPACRHAVVTAWFAHPRKVSRRSVLYGTPSERRRASSSLRPASLPSLR